MAQEGRTQLKTYFETDDAPTEDQFANLIDSGFNITDDTSDNISEGSTNLFITAARVLASVIGELSGIIVNSAILATDTIKASLGKLQGQINGNITSISTLDSTKENIIYIPSSEPEIVTGTPNELTIDMDSVRQSMFEPRLSTGTRSINVDFDLTITNDTNALLLSCLFSLTGTRIISFESDVLVSNASSIGTWDDTGKELTLTTGTDDIIEFQFLRDRTASTWLLKVAEVAL